MTVLQDQPELKFHTVDKTPLVGVTFKTTFKHLENHYHYEIFVRVPNDHNQPDATYETIEEQRMKKIASMGGFQTQGLAFEAMVVRVDEFLRMAQS